MADEIPADIEALVRERRKIEAIKQLRLRTGIDLKAAKDRIDAVERQLGLVTAMSATTKSSIYWVVVIVVGLVIYWVSTTFPTR